jgi:CheY-like chemotaxis protein
MASGGPREVLLLEQCDDLRDVLCEVLGARGYHVFAYASLAEALQAPARALHAVLVAVNGYLREPHDDLDAVLRERNHIGAPIVALVSGNTAISLPGVTLSLRKPVDEEQLCAALERCAQGAAQG